MASITINVVQTSQPTLNKTFTMVDSDMDLMVQAYQIRANRSLPNGGIATRGQVLNFIVTDWMAQIANQIQQNQIAIPSPIVIT